MRMSPQQVDLMAFEVVRDLEEAELVAGDKEKLARLVARAISEDLAVEDALDADVHEILKGYQDYMRANDVEYSEMFERIKQKLARERKLTL